MNLLEKVTQNNWSNRHINVFLMDERHITSCSRETLFSQRQIREIVVCKGVNSFPGRRFSTFGTTKRRNRDWNLASLALWNVVGRYHFCAVQNKVNLDTYYDSIERHLHLPSNSS